jgi:hypothetical protein
LNNQNYELMKKLFFKLFTISLIFLLACLSKNDTVESNATIPEAGDYISFTVTGNLSYDYRFNQAQKSWEWQWNPGIQFSPSPFGRLRINRNKTYEFIDLKKSGTFKYEESSNKLIFSGFMQGAEGIYKIQNGTAILLISSKAQDGSINTIQFEKKLATLQVDLTNPNGIFDGKIVLSATSSTTDHFDLKIAKITKTFISNTTAVTNESNLHIFTYLDNPFDASEDYGHVVISDEKGKELRRFRGKSNQYKKWIIGDYWYVSLSPDGTKFALTGYYLEHSFVFDPNYVKPYPIVSIFDFDGNELRSFRTSKDFGWGAAWLPNGGLIFADEKGGINITDKDFKQVSKIYNQDVLEARCSPDGKIVAFAKGGQIFTMKLFKLLFFY